MADKKNRQRSYLAKDYNDFRSDLLRYARTFFPDRIQDFSESSVGGLFLDMAAAVGDNMSYYLDHQFRELSWSDAVEVANLQKHLENNAVKIVGDSPSSTEVTFFVEVPSTLINGVISPDPDALPTILADTILESTNGVTFTTVDDLNFGATDRLGRLRATVQVGDIDAAGNPLTFILSANVTVVSGEITSEDFNIGSGFVPFREITLVNPNVSEILSVVDSEGNNWYEVDSLTQDTVFVGITNTNEEGRLVSENIKMIPAPKRFVAKTDLQTRNTVLQFGGGDPTLNDDDVLSDPSKLALPVFGRGTIPRFTLDPNSLLRSRTLGEAPIATTLTVTYRYGGGQNHNVSAGTIRSIKEIRVEFRNNPTFPLLKSVKDSIDVINNQPATGGDSAPTLEQLRAQIPAAKNSQQRIVTKEDLIARIYTLPSRFGRVFRAGVSKSLQNPLSSILHVVSKDDEGRLIQSPDALKQNIQKYINEYRLISDAIDVVDARIINYTVKVSIVPDPEANPIDLTRQAISKIKGLLNVNKFQIDQPIQISSIFNEVIRIPGILSIIDIEIRNIRGSIGDQTYSNVFFDTQANTRRGLVIAPQGSIFELKYPETDIIVTTV